MIFKEKALQDLAETSNNIFKSLRGKCKITEKRLKFFTIAYNEATNLGQMYLLPKIHKRLFNVPGRPVTVARLQERFQSFWIVILKVLCKKPGPI